jgi:hypothetical protein
MLMPRLRFAGVKRRLHLWGLGRHDRPWRRSAGQCPWRRPVTSPCDEAAFGQELPKGRSTVARRAACASERPGPVGQSDHLRALRLGFARRTTDPLNYSVARALSCARKGAQFSAARARQRQRALATSRACDVR